MAMNCVDKKETLVKRSLRLALLAAPSIWLAACATPPAATVNYPAPAPAPVQAPAPAPAPLPAPVPAAPAVDTSAGERALVAAIGSYDRGEFGSAIRQLTPMTTDGSLDAPQTLRALKVLAFSHCSAGALTACRQTFERAFRADANFELAPAERGHPIWGPQFDRARKTVTGR